MRTKGHPDYTAQLALCAWRQRIFEQSHKDSQLDAAAILDDSLITLLTTVGELTASQVSHILSDSWIWWPKYGSELIGLIGTLHIKHTPIKKASGKTSLAAMLLLSDSNDDGMSMRVAAKRQCGPEDELSIPNNSLGVPDNMPGYIGDTPTGSAKRARLPLEHDSSPMMAPFGWSPNPSHHLHAAPRPTSDVLAPPRTTPNGATRLHTPFPSVPMNPSPRFYHQAYGHSPALSTPTHVQQTPPLAHPGLMSLAAMDQRGNHRVPAMPAAHHPTPPPFHTPIPTLSHHNVMLTPDLGHVRMLNTPKSYGVPDGQCFESSGERSYHPQFIPPGRAMHPPPVPPPSRVQLHGSEVRPFPEVSRMPALSPHYQLTASVMRTTIPVQHWHSSHPPSTPAYPTGHPATHSHAGPSIPDVSAFELSPTQLSKPNVVQYSSLPLDGPSHGDAQLEPSIPWQTWP